MTVWTIQPTFARGEMSPRLHGRVDVEHYQNSLASCQNFIVMRQGGLTRRPGFKLVHQLRDMSEAARLVRFEFNVEQAYVVCFNDSFIRFFTLGGIVTAAAQNITGISKASPGVVTYSGTDTYANGDRVLITGVVGMTEVNNREFTVANVDTGNNTFELSGVDTSTYGTWSSGGTVAEIYEIASPYAAADLADLQFAQSGDTLYIAHADYAPRKLVRTSETSWAISTISFDDGPYLDEDVSVTTMTPAETGAVHPIMTGLSAPSGTVANDEADADAWEAFDGDPGTIVGMTGLPAWLSYDFASTNTKVCDAYWIKALPSANLVRSPTAWKFQGYDGSAWKTIDSRQDETSWSGGETRYFENNNEIAFQSYRLYFTGSDGDMADNIDFAETGWHEAGDSQTAFNLTASAITDINSGAGFATTDVGRTIRLMGSDGLWRWAYIVARTSTTLVTIRLYGHSLPSTEIITHWQMSAWYATGNYPAAVGFFEDRLGWAATDAEPRKVWLSRTSSYEDHGSSTPVQDSDGINAEMAGGQLNRVSWIEALSDLIVATPGAIHVMGPTDPGSPFSSTNIRQRPQSTIGAAAIQPIVIGYTLIYIDRYKQRIFELAYDFNVNSYISRELSILSDHLFTPTVTATAFQQQPHNLAFYVCADGTVPTLTYEKGQNIAGWTKTIVAGGDADTEVETDLGITQATVESVASIPSAGGDMVYAVVKRTIASGTVRYVEIMADFYETGDAVEDAVYLDSALIYDSTDASSFAGYWHLRGESVAVFADGIDLGNVTLSSTGGFSLASVTAHTGITLPATASVVTVGKRYRSYAETLRAPQSGNQDGTALGRKMRVNDVAVDMMDTGHLKAGTLEQTRDVAYRQWDSARATPVVLVTGIKDVLAVDKHRNNGVVVMETDFAYPATIRALVVALDGEP